MQALVDFLASYEPQYRDLVRGHSSADIARIESALGRSLPSFYREFLATAAANLGFLHDELDFDADELVDFIEIKRPMIDELGGQAILVAVDDTISQMDYYIHLGRPAPHRPGDGELVRSASGGRGFDDDKTGYDCLSDLLFSRGFRDVRMLRFRVRKYIVWRAQDEADARRMMAILSQSFDALGFTVPVATGPRTPLFDREDCAAIGRMRPSSRAVSIYLACRNPKELDLVAHTLLDQMPVQGDFGAVAPFPDGLS